MAGSKKITILSVPCFEFWLLLHFTYTTRPFDAPAGEFGVSRMFIIYTASGVIGFWISCLFGVLFTIGASASICGLIGAMLFYGKSRGGVYGQAIYRQVFG